jgi:hypothetical protein
LPTVLRDGPYRLFFYSADGVERPHVHVEREQSEAKFWLLPVQFAYNRGFAAVEIRKVEQLVREHEELILRKWHEHFGKPTRDRPSRNGR